mmetsp:Transcript_12287/g.33744  ORF Transcript_12287/g.33744 Transcript_12287/m.33744 type:complete len:108 (-) Transcript_12287:150-473(-)
MLGAPSFVLRSLLVFCKDDTQRSKRRATTNFVLTLSRRVLEHLLASEAGLPGKSVSDKSYTDTLLSNCSHLVAEKGNVSVLGFWSEDHYLGYLRAGVATCSFGFPMD